MQEEGINIPFCLFNNDLLILFYIKFINYKYKCICLAITIKIFILTFSSIKIKSNNIKRKIKNHLDSFGL